MSGDLHLLAGAYVLDALDADERLRFEAHLGGCAACTTEAAELRAIAGRLAPLTAEPPPPGLRQSVLDGAGDPPGLATGGTAGPWAAARGPLGPPALLVAAVVAVAVLAVDLRSSHRTLDRSRS